MFDPWNLSHRQNYGNFTWLRLELLTLLNGLSPGASGGQNAHTQQLLRSSSSYTLNYDLQKNISVLLHESFET